MGCLRDAIADYVAQSLVRRPEGRIRDFKMIHDPIHGSNQFAPYEIAVLDLPLLQRIRRVSQTDLVSLVFPSGNHNRFEHTLGVTVIAGRVAKALRDKYPDLVTESDIRHVRMAAILHDCGHGPFSHMTEDVYRSLEDFPEIQEEPEFVDRSPHEILSALVVTSAPFQDYMKKVIEKEYGITFDVQLIADMIVGWSRDPGRAFLADIISGAFDADKLDYIQRDSHFTGVRMALDLDRLLYTVCVMDVVDQTGTVKKKLSVDITGVTALEQIMFDKMILHSTVYHHHKVRAAECLLRATLEAIRSKGVKVRGWDLSSPADFLYLTDHDILSVQSGEEKLDRMVSDLRDRRLFKRALVISKQTVTPESMPRYDDLLKLHDKPAKLRQLREAIYESCRDKGDISREEIWVDLPKPPSFKEGSQWPSRCPEASGPSY